MSHSPSYAWSLSVHTQQNRLCRPRETRVMLLTKIRRWPWRGSADGLDLGRVQAEIYPWSRPWLFVQARIH